MTQKIMPCLWFDDNAEEALAFYTAVFPRSRVTDTARYGDAGPGPKGRLMTAILELDGQELMLLDGGPPFKFTPAVSLVVRCESQAEVDAYWDRFLAGGTPSQCGWITDRFGLSWQIVPTRLNELVRDADPVKVERVMRAMLQMVKLDVPTLERAYGGE